MTPSEFKAWFDGFTEAFNGRLPTKAQWKRVQERVAEIDGKPVTERVYLDRYWPYYPYATTWVAGSSPDMGTGTIINGNTAVDSGTWSATTAMYALGKADAINAEALG